MATKLKQIAFILWTLDSFLDILIKLLLDARTHFLFFSNIKRKSMITQMVLHNIFSKRFLKLCKSSNLTKWLELTKPKIAKPIYMLGVASESGRIYCTYSFYNEFTFLDLSLIHIWRCRRSTLCRSRWSPYH